MKSADENPLVREILADESLSEFRDASLDRALVELRQARRRRRTARIAVMMFLPLALVAICWLKFSTTGVETRPTATGRDVEATAAPGARTAESTRIQSAELADSAVLAPAVETITDEELFALFPNRALALIGPPGRQQLVFLDRPMHN